MLLHVSGVEIPLWVPPIVAFGISFVTCVAGISGAFLLVPLQMSVLGSAPSISATTHLFNALAIPGGVISYGREGRIVWPLAAVLVAGTLPGVILGALVRVTVLRGAVPFEIFVSVVLLWIGSRLVRDLVRRRRASSRADEAEADFRKRVGERGSGHDSAAPSVSGARIDRHGVRFDFCDQAYAVPLAAILPVSLGVGFVGGVYGIGGGSIIAPFLVSFLGLPIYAVAGPALLSTLVTSAVGMGAFQLLAPFYPAVSVAPEWTLGLLLGIGGAAGMYLGGRAQKHIPGTAIRWLLAIITLGMGAKYVLNAIGG